MSKYCTFLPQEANLPDEGGNKGEGGLVERDVRFVANSARLQANRGVLLARESPLRRAFSRSLAF